MNRRHLLISPYFPPASRIGAKRALHLCRHLPRYGWNPVILAAPPYGDHTDSELAALVPAKTVVSWSFDGGPRRWLDALRKRRAQRENDRQRNVRQPWRQGSFFGWNTNFLTPFDRYLGELPAAVRAGFRLVRRHDLQAIQVSADPWTGLLAGLALHRLTGLPLLPDLRDPWSLHFGKMALRPPWSRECVKRIERHVFRHAARIIVNTENACEAYRQAYYDLLPAERFVAVRNAFDPDVFYPAPFRSPSEFTVLYFGRFRLFFEPDVLLAGFKRFVERRGLGPDTARFSFVGRLRDSDWEKIDRLALRPFVDLRGHVAYRHCLQELRAAHVLLLIVEPACRLQNPAKLYDYLAAGRPVLAVSANREVNRILASTGAGESVSHGDPAAMARRLDALYTRFKRGEALRVDPRGVQPYTAAEQARAIGAVLDAVTADRPRGEGKRKGA
jgi:glycosyltransferase involved in cell wall biosynthesis